MKHVFIAVPSYTGNIEAETRNSITRSVELAKKRGWNVTDTIRCGDSMIPRARNFLVQQFLNSEATDLVFVDADVAWDGDELCQLVEYPVDLVAGCYPSRCEPLRYTVRWINERQDLIADPETGLLEVEGLPTGFMRISRACAEKMVAGYPQYECDEPLLPNGKYTAMFAFEMANRVEWSEDFVFCNRWRAIGGQVWLAPDMTLHHIGKKQFTGNIGSWLRNRA